MSDSEPDRKESDEDPESLGDIVRDNILVVLAIALLIAFGVFALVFAFGH
jgi:hypothetical protein